MKQKYNIISTDNINYFKNTWSTVYDPNKGEESIKKIRKTEEPLKGVCLIKL
jgi:hypothetical protein